MTHQEIAGYVGAGTGILSVIIAITAIVKANRANKISQTANRLNIDTFKRQGAIELHMAWRDVNEIDPEELIGPDVNRASNALDLTASLWNHDVMKKEILYQSYFTESGDLKDEPAWWERFLDRIHGRFEDLLEPGLECDQEP